VENWAHYLTPSALHRGLGLVCLGVGAQTSTQRLDRPRALDCHAAVLLTRGTGELDVGSYGERIRLAAPTLFWLRPGVPHTYGPDGEGWTESWVLFDGSAVAGYESLGYIPTRQAAQPLRDPLPLILVLERLAEVCGDRRQDIDVAAGALVHELLVTAKRAATLTGVTEDDRLVAGLRAEAMRELSVAERAARLGVSPRRLRLAVRRAEACTPTELVHRMRVNRAKALLAGTDLSVTEVARTVGFGDPAYFSRHFRASVGLPPRAFRAQQQQFLR
jgi:AraC-like DNA-binding protein